ncbi:hypothetical protein AAFF_G00341870 [Aldrovandia affinis]|uniref:Uncharacterized protein n=1 Tax=Aldrovandia affinis TaxID=143900 RepID=A0AAD7WQ97_9TELE|nr:hypothetical protein AAFF_G00341870 [Aldrovandia affinis]
MNNGNYDDNNNKAPAWPTRKRQWRRLAPALAPPTAGTLPIVWIPGPPWSLFRKLELARKQNLARDQGNSAACSSHKSNPRFAG